MKTFAAILALFVASATSFAPPRVANTVRSPPVVVGFRPSALRAVTEKQGTAVQTEKPVQAEEVEEPKAFVIEETMDIVMEEPEEEESETKKLLNKIKEAGTAGVISYAAWEMVFWFVSIPTVCLGYYKVAGHWPDFSNKEDMASVGAEAFAFVNFARLAVPLRIGLALSTTPWIEKNVVEKFFNKDENED